jgi:purine nucleosidase
VTRRIVLDVDTGIDDAIALLYLARHEEAEVVAAGSVHGNCTALQAATNTRYTLDLAGLPDVPVAVGAARPLAQPLSVEVDAHGPDGLGGVFPQGASATTFGLESAAAQLVRLARESPGELTVLATGPLTNLALALMLDPELPRLVRDVVVMGGAVEHPGNVTTDAEANIWHDPEAADLVFQAAWDLTLIALDVTMQTILDGDRLAAVERATGVVPQFASQVLAHYVDAYERYLGIRGAAMHDPLAAAVALDPSLVTCTDMPVRVELRGELTRGATIGERRAGPRPGVDRPLVHVATTVDADRFLDDLVRRLVEPRPVAVSQA